MRNPLSDRIVEIKPSGIRILFDIVSEMPDGCMPVIFCDNGFLMV